MIGDASQYLAEISFRVETVEFGRSDQAVNDRRAFAAGIGRQFIMPEFWHAKLVSRTRFIPWRNKASSFSVNTSTLELYTYLFEVQMERRVYFQAG